MEQITYTLRNISKDQLVHEFQNIFWPIFKISNKHNTTTIFILEEYYYRIESNLSITVIFDNVDDNSVEINAIASGGKKGIIQFSRGAEKKALKKFNSIIWEIQLNWLKIEFGIGNIN